MTFEALVAKVKQRAQLVGADSMFVALVGAVLKELGISVDEASGELTQSPVTSPLGWKAPGEDWREIKAKHDAPYRGRGAEAVMTTFLKQAIESDMGVCGDANNPNGDGSCGERVRYFVIGPKDSSVSCGCTVEGAENANGCPPVGFGAGSKRKPGNVIELPYLDGVQHAEFPRQLQTLVEQ